MAWSYRKNARRRNSEKDAERKAVYNKTKRKTKNEMAGWRVHGPEKDGNKRMERQCKGSRGLEAYCKGGQEPPRAVATSKKKKKRPFISSYGFRSRVLVCMDLVPHHKKRYKCAHCTPVLRENFLLTPLLNLSWGLLTEVLHVDSRWPACILFRDSWPYLLVRLVLPHPVTSLAAQVSMLFNLGARMPRGAFWVVICHRNLCLIA